MHPRLRPTAGQQQRLCDHAKSVDSDAFFNRLTGPQLLAGAEELLPDHRERLFPPAETLSMFLAQVLSAEGSCRQAVNDAALKRLVGGLFHIAARTPAPTVKRGRVCPRR